MGFSGFYSVYLKIFPKKERQKHDEKAKGLPRRPGDKAEPKQADIEKYYAEYPDRKSVV